MRDLPTLYLNTIKRKLLLNALMFDSSRILTLKLKINEGILQSDNLKLKIKIN